MGQQLPWLLSPRATSLSTRANTLSSSRPYDVAIIGGGIVGLATARALVSSPRPRPRNRSVVVLEAEPRIGAHQTGHNSGVIHSGLYYRPDSLKARTCTAGRRELYAFCRHHEIPHERCGKLVVAVDESEVPALEELERRGRANGLEGLIRLSSEGIREREPAVAGVAGLWVPETGIVDYGRVAEACAQEILDHGGEVRTEAAVKAVKSRGPEHILETSRGDVRCSLLINCAGLWADRVARLCGHQPSVRIIPFRGEYLDLVRSRQDLIKGLVYPVPDSRFPFLGVHFTRTIHGRVHAGPNAVLALSRAGYSWGRISPRDLWDTLSYPGFHRLSARYWRIGFGEIHRSLRRAASLRALRRLVPALELGDLESGGAGVRAQALDRDGRLVDDFLVERSVGMIHVLNAVSPAATSSLAIGRHIAAMVD